MSNQRHRTATKPCLRLQKTYTKNHTNCTHLNDRLHGLHSTTLRRYALLLLLLWPVAWLAEVGLQRIGL
jgi:hypothetical protein